MHQEKQKVENLLQEITPGSDARVIQKIADQMRDIDNEATGALLSELLKARFNETLLAKAFSDLENLGKQKSSDKTQYQRVLDSVVSSADLTLIGSNSDNRVYVMQLITLLKGLYKRSQKNGYSMVKDNLSKSYTGKSREEIAKYFEDAAIKLLGQLSAISVQGVVNTETHTTISTHIEQKTIQNGQPVESKIDISISEDKRSTVRYETHVPPLNENKQNNSHTAYLPPEIVDKSQRFKKLMTEIDAESIDEKQIDILLNEINNFKASLSSSGLKLNAQKIQFEKDYKEYQFLLNTLLKEHSLDQMHSLIKEGTKKRELYQASLEELELKDKVHPDGMTHFSKNSDEEKLLNSLSESYQSGKSGSFFSPSSWKNWFTLRETKQLLQAQLKNSIEETDEKLTILEDTYKNGLFLLKMAKDVSAQMQEKETAQKNMASCGKTWKKSNKS